MSSKEISPAAVHKLHEAGTKVLLIDVREEDEWEEVRVPYARHFPLSTLSLENLRAACGLDARGTTEPLYFICAVGGRSHRAAEYFYHAGYPEATNVTGGMRSWLASGLPTTP
jgi:rhodanese-related sulfurtransferase